MTDQDRNHLDEAAQATRAEERARTILESISDAFFSLAPDWTFTYLNPQAGRILNRPPAELLGKSIWTEYPGLHGSDFEPIYRNAMDHRVAGGITQFYPDHDCWYEVHTYPSAGGISVFFRDVSEGKRAERERHRLQLELEHSLAAREAERANLAAIVIEMVRAREVLEERESRFRQLADAMPQIVWSATPDGELNYYNRKWFEYIKLPEDDAENAQWARYVHPDDLPRVASEWASSLKTGDPYSLEFRVRNGDGNYRWFLVRALPVRDPQGAIIRWFGTCTDIEDRRKIEAERERLLSSERDARAQLERASRMKDEFLATLSHEIRTPLNAILGWSQIMRSSTDPNDIAQGLEVIERNARAQTQIVEDLLDMSRIISGKVRLDVQRLDLASIVQTSVETARPTAEAKGLRLHSVIDPLPGVVVSGDAGRVQQVLWNLISNAIKFTPRGGRVQVVLERVNSHLEISIIDSGEGIKTEFLPYVFDRFRQADASTTRRHGGLGLGLSIVKQLVELHGGSVHVSSAGTGHGTAFVVKLPLIAVHPEPDAQERRHPRVLPTSASVAQEKCDQIHGVRVLVVDDEPDARSLVQRLLEDCHAVVTSTGSVAEALQLLQTGTFDVLVSDIGMPVEDGYTLIRRVRALPPAHGGNIPAIALTAYARAEDRVRAVSAGFQMHIAKPVEPIELITMVASAAGRTPYHGFPTRADSVDQQEPAQ